VGVFAQQPADEIAKIVDAVGLDVIQLHGGVDVARVEDVRRVTGAEIWAVVRLDGGDLPIDFSMLQAAADAVLLDTLVVGSLGGTGVSLPWEQLAEPLARERGTGRKLVLAGGLRADNVAWAIGALSPDVVDVSSGVESAPGVKDHERMRAFRDAVVRSTGRSE
jgi:phosphoribosylanthranilate isomerase